MANTSAKPSIIPAFIALFVLAFVAYLMFTNLKSTRVEHDISPAIEIIDPPPLIVIKPEAKALTPEQEADIFVNNLATTEEFITINENEDRFVRNDSVIVLPDLEYQATTKQGLLADKSLNADTPITLNYVTHDKVKTTLAELSDTIEDPAAPITIITDDGTQIISPLADILHHQELELSTEITYIIQQKHRVDTTVGELKNIDIPADLPLIATITRGSEAVTLKDLTKSGRLPDDALFYLHRVTDRDVQGLWGIIQAGLIEKFKQGIELEGITRHKDLIQAIIPGDADEKLPSGLSSFLGKILKSKVDNSYIYNLKTRSMGHDANLIFPGQQLILIHFPKVELKQIYQFFSKQQRQNAETYAITN
ncbi:hypothetical protein LCGC14_1738930 [marine sediment metagenome]|uniref:Uncharacterized protein n=1 Tax=marine sediment metagenome TaxID=412755 RepID=A0A0F9JMK6_9ZZZZ|nr:hypothetical protein [Methylophaga sp.]